jgi:phosphate acetyltransferase
LLSIEIRSIANPATTRVSIIDRIRSEAIKKHKRIVLGDAFDDRMVRAARIATDLGLARITLAGERPIVQAAAERAGVSLDRIEIAAISECSYIDDLVAIFRETPKGSALKDTEAYEEVMSNELLFAALLAASERADGVLAGSLSTTGNLIRAALRGIGLVPGVSVLSSMFLMAFGPLAGLRGEGFFLGFGDCAVIPDPTAAQLADIAISSADTYLSLTGNLPIVALLSFSTKGSAGGARVEKVVEALKIVQDKAPHLLIDGEMQFDAAFVADVGKRKAPDSAVAGRANVMIFPDLDAGNIGYKIAERMGSGQAIGPVMQGLRRPMNDLSRGAHLEDIVNMIAITALQAA